MIKRLLHILLAFPTLLLANAPASQSPPEFRHLNGGTIAGVFFFSDQIGWTAEDGARVRYTGNGGQDWDYGRTPDVVREELTDVYFINALDGWAVSAGGNVLGSDDGGVNWTLLTSTPLLDPSVEPPDQPPPAHLNTIFMFDSADGWLGGDNGALYVTSNGGADWALTSNLPDKFEAGEPDPQDPYKIRFFDSNAGVMAADYAHVYRTTNGGTSWAAYDLDLQLTLCPSLPPSHPNLELWDFDFSDSSNGWLVGGHGFQDGYIFRTTDGGATWSQWRCFDEKYSPLDCTPPTNYAVATLDWPQAVCGGYESRTLILESGSPGFDACGCTESPSSGPCSVTGDFWKQRYQLGWTNAPVFAAARIDDDTACLTGAFGFIRLVNPSATTYQDLIQEKANEHFVRLEGGDFIDNMEGCVTGQGNTIYRTIDGGGEWDRVYPTGTPDSTVWGRDLKFSTTGQYGIAVGDSGFVAYSSNDSASWSLSNLVSANNYEAVAFIPNTDDALMGGVGGILRKSTDGGLNWSSPISIGTTEKITAICFADANVGYLVGTGRLARMTTDGGSTWSQETLAGNGAVDLYGVATWGNGSQAIAVGTNADVYEKTSTQFVKLNLSALGVTSHLTDVEVFAPGSDLHVRICGFDGLMLFRDNGTWSLPKSQTNQPHSALSFLTADEGFGIGRPFLITKYD